MTYIAIRVELARSPEVKRVILAADPSYRKRTATLLVVESVPITGTYWSDGSRSTYHAVRLTDGRSLGAPQYDPPQFGGPRETPIAAIPEGVAIVETGVFCGKTAEAYVYLHPANATPLLPG